MALRQLGTSAAGFVGSSGASGVAVDLTKPVNTAQRTKHEPLITTASAGDLNLVLGAAPLNNKVLAWVKTGAAAPVLLFDTSYSVSGINVTIPSLLSGDKVKLVYDYDADVDSSPANATTDVATLFANYNVATTPGTTPATAIGVASTGQTPSIFGGGAWGVDTDGLYKNTVGLATSDGIQYDAISADGWTETLFVLGSGLTGAGGLSIRGGTSSTDRIHTTATMLVRRSTGGNTTIATFSQTFAPGDAQAILAIGSTIKVYRRAGNTGAWVLVCTVTETFQQTNLRIGIRNGDASGKLTKYAYLKVIPSRTAPPVAS